MNKIHKKYLKQMLINIVIILLLLNQIHAIDFLNIFKSESPETIITSIQIPQNYTEIQLNYYYIYEQELQISIEDISNNNQTLCSFEVTPQTYHQNLTISLKSFENFNETSLYQIKVNGNYENLTIMPGYVYNQQTVYDEGMNEFYNQPGRPQFHFSQVFNWINDPNGLSYWQGYYHMFQQFCPYQLTWCNMNWGHAVSKDLIHWKVFPIALYPGDPRLNSNPASSGGAYSGSAISQGNRLAIILTNSYNDYSGNSAQQEFQNITFTDDGLNFYNNHKVIVDTVNNSDASNFRDPKIFYDEIEKAYFAIIGNSYNGKGAVLLYKATDSTLEQWSFISVLYEETVLNATMIECPNFALISNTSDSEQQYILIMSLMIGSNHQTLARVGTFNRSTFTFNPSTPHQQLNFGRDFYATQIFSLENSSNKVIQVSWMQNWGLPQVTYGNNNFAGVYSLPTVLTLQAGSNKILSNPIEEVSSLRLSQEPSLEYNANMTGTTQIFENIPELFELQLTLPTTSDNWQIGFISKNATNQSEGIWVGFNSSEQCIFIQDNIQINNIFTQSSQTTQELAKEVNFRIFFDKQALEVFANEGIINGYYRYPTILGNIKLVVQTSAQNTNNFQNLNMKVYELGSIW